jgi:hypothetical protein
MKEIEMDRFEDALGWIAVASGESEMKISAEGESLRLDFDFRGGGGFVVARKEFARSIPHDYSFSFRVRGKAPKNNLEFKMEDASGRNVWRWQERAFAFRTEPREIHLKGSQIEFAWGPAGGGRLKKLGAIEFVITAGPGGKGTVWIDKFLFRDRTARRKTLVTASGQDGIAGAGAVIDKGRRRVWRSKAEDLRPWLCLDFQEAREYGGLVIDWELGAPESFAVQASGRGEKWRTLHIAKEARGKRTFVYLPGGNSRFVRLVFDGPNVGIRHLEVKPFDFSRSLTDFFYAVAKECPRGHFPRYLHRQQSYWTVGGIPDGRSSALINEEGMVEPSRGSFSIEPFLHMDGRLVTWADVRRSVSLENHDLPIPSTHWKLPGLSLKTTVFTTGHGSRTVVILRYRVVNTAKRRRSLKLFAAVRPFQVTPPWQAWKGLGGVSKIVELAWDNSTAWINKTTAVIPLTRPSGFGATTFEGGQITDYLAEGKLPESEKIRDPFGFASAAFQFDLELMPGCSEEIFIAFPSRRAITPKDGAVEFEKTVAAMTQRLGGVSLETPAGLPASAAKTFKTAMGHILINRDGHALQPGPRRYTRSWIRDGVIMGASLQRAGDITVLPEFVRWFASYQRKDGFVPCCVDHNGADDLVEHDSHGQLIFGVRESFRFSADLAFLKELWPNVRKAALFIGRLRSRHLAGKHRKGDRSASYGLLPESVSHEGYLSHPVHSYWDDFWALRGLLDAAAIADTLGRKKDAETFTTLARSFRKALARSIDEVIGKKHLAYVPGSVEWADFDPTATANAVALLQFGEILPQKQLDSMFDVFIRDVRRKRSGEMPWNNYTAYEIRIIGALVRQGKRKEAQELLERFLADRRPLNWNQWPEISWHNPRSPGHLGDLPHTWISAEYMLSFASLFAYEHEADSSLVIGAGIPASWISSRRGIVVRGLGTWYGQLDLSMRLGEDLVIELSGALRIPEGGFVLRPPVPGSIRLVTINGKASHAFLGDEVRVKDFPGRIVISFERSAFSL